MAHAQLLLTPSRKHICQRLQDRWSSIKTLYFVLAFSQRQRDEQFIHEYYSDNTFVCVWCEGKSAFVHEKKQDELSNHPKLTSSSVQALLKMPKPFRFM